jgi:bifunctional ADP-heptose synthase (sugar kinase/adenylyltransferase)
VKGGDYTIETINQAERRTLEAAGSVIRILPRMGNISTTAILRGEGE